jgi:uncharacterized protein with HEPN domain
VTLASISRISSNLLIHHYFGIDLAIIWDVLETKLPQLEKQVQTILDSLSAP